MFGVRADRVVAHGSAPTGFLVHGGESVLWTAYLGGLVPRGAEFVRTVDELAGRAGVERGLLQQARPRDRRCELLRAVFVRAEAELMSERGENARAYLEERGFPSAAIERCRLGLFPDRRFLAEALERQGYTAAEVGATGVLADSRWPGRIVGCWRDEHDNARTLWARTISHSPEEGSRYLYLRGAARAGLPPYGLSTVLTGSLDRRREVVLVEGVIDVHALRAHGVENVCALGGTSIRSAMFERVSGSAWRRSRSASTTTKRAEPPPCGQLNKRHAPPRAPRCLSSTPNSWRRRRIPTPTYAPTARPLSPGCLGRASARSAGARWSSRVSSTPNPIRSRGEPHSHAPGHGLGDSRRDSHWNKKTPSGQSRNAAATASKPSSARSTPATGNHLNALTPAGREPR